MLLLIDNYDSFSYNLYQLLGEVLLEEGRTNLQNPENPDIRVIRNDELKVEEIRALNPGGIIISPGPGRPADAGICEDLVRAAAGENGWPPILGVCLGEQGICEALGATITYAKELMHGKQSIASLDLSSPVFRGLPEKIPVARYHSLAVDASTMPAELQIIATADDGEVMGVAHRQKPIYGLQFHPESIMTPDGKTILKNFVDLAGDAAGTP